MNAIEYTQEWQEYQRGLDYKRRINLFATVDKNERFFGDRQWEGVVSNGLPTPQFNIVKRIVNFKVSSIMSDAVSINYSIEGIADNPDDPMKAQQLETAENLSKFSKTVWERLKMDQANENILRDAALSGDGIIYFYWDPDVVTGQEVAGVPVLGDIAKEEIDNVNIFFGNPNCREVQAQPYIIMAFRKMVDELKEEAKKNGVPKREIDLITPDTETENQAGDAAKIELEERNKAICLLKLWRNKETGTIWAKKSTRQATVRKEWDTGLRRYPVAMMNWEVRKNSYHGIAEVSGIIPNQIAINKLFAMIIMSVMHTAFPKAIYDASRIGGAWSNTIGQAIPVQGEITGAATYLNPGNLSPDIHRVLDAVIVQTKEMAGANETALGETEPRNTSAIIAVQQASAIPLESTKRRFYQYIEDIALIWIDFWTTYYGQRQLMIEERGNKIPVDYNGDEYRNVPFRAKIDVGPSSKWSEVAAIQTLDALLEKDRITFLEYLERIPDGLIPKKTELIEDRKMQDLDQIIIETYLKQVFLSLPPEIQQQLASLPDKQAMMQQLKQIAVQQMQGGGVQNAAQEGVV